MKVFMLWKQNKLINLIKNMKPQNELLISINNLMITNLENLLINW